MFRPVHHVGEQSAVSDCIWFSRKIPQAVELIRHGGSCPIRSLQGPEERYGAFLPEFFAVKCCQTQVYAFCQIKNTKIDFSRGFARTPLGELTSLPKTPQLMGGGQLPPPKDPTPASALRVSLLRASSLLTTFHRLWKILCQNYFFPRVYQIGLLLTYDNTALP